MAVQAFVALGANLGDPVATLRAAIEALRGTTAAKLLTVSSLYRTAPVGLKDQPDFINAVALLEVDDSVLPASTFLLRLFDIEASFGRIRSIRNAPRTLDLDLLLFGDTVCTSPGLTLPHPRLAERAFVLAPLAEIAPTLEIPGYGCVAELLTGSANQRIERLS